MLLIFAHFELSTIGHEALVHFSEVCKPRWSNQQWFYKTQACSSVKYDWEWEEHSGQLLCIHSFLAQISPDFKIHQWKEIQNGRKPSWMSLSVSRFAQKKVCDNETIVKTSLKAEKRNHKISFHISEVCQARMAGSNEAELEEVIASFRRVWRSGGRASLSLHANQGELEVRFGRKR